MSACNCWTSGSMCCKYRGGQFYYQTVPPIWWQPSLPVPDFALQQCVAILEAEVAELKETLKTNGEQSVP